MEKFNTAMSIFERVKKEGEVAPFIEEYGKGTPIITFVACMHGNEVVGLHILEILRKQSIFQGTMRLVVANPKAVFANKRYINHDLNRCFPGRKNGTYEERLAYRLEKQLSDSDFLVDLHTTTAQTPSFIIVRQGQMQVKRLIEMTNIKRVVLRPRSGKALIDHVRTGIGIELGPHNDFLTLKRGVSSVFSVLSDLNMIKKKEKVGRQPVEYFTVNEVLPMFSNFKEADERIKNFCLIKEGDIIGIRNGVQIKAKKDFYPILYGESSYKNILCWIGERV